MVLLSAAAATMSAWYGPFTYQLPITTQGNPFDPAVNDVRVYFKPKSGKPLERLAYFSHGKWLTKVYLPSSGPFDVSISVNGDIKQVPQNFGVKGEAIQDPMVRRDGKFFKVQGQPFWPIGINTAWNGGPNRQVPSYFRTMNRSGMNWARVWACHWDNRNPYWLEKPPHPQDNTMSELALDRWDDVIEAAEREDIKFQLVLFHHGQFSTDVNPNWGEHPWNVKNGGFLANAADFFTDPEAKRRTKMMLRYFVARYSASPSIMAWELFNEVQFVERVRKQNDWATVGKWHDEMAKYIRSIDPYKHLITTSSELEKPIWKEMDYMQGHGYPPSVSGMLLGTENKWGKPMFFGEIGPGGAGEGNATRDAQRAGIWAGFFAGHSGAGQYWFWDQMNPAGYDEYKFSTDILKTLPTPRSFKKQKVGVKVETGADLVFTPGRGWEPSAQTTFNLPQDASPASSGKLSAYIQGVNNRAMQPKPLTFKFTASKPGALKIRATEVSGGADAHLTVTVNKQVVLDRDFKKGTRLTGPDSTLTIPFVSGRNEIVINNTGTDWVNLNRYTFSEIAPLATVMGAKSGNTVVVHAKALSENTPIQLMGTGLANGLVNIALYDLDTKRKQTLTRMIEGGRITLALPSKEQIIVLTQSQD